MTDDEKDFKVFVILLFAVLSLFIATPLFLPLSIFFAARLYKETGNKIYLIGVLIFLAVYLLFINLCFIKIEKGLEQFERTLEINQYFSNGL